MHPIYPIRRAAVATFCAGRAELTPQLISLLP